MNIDQLLDARRLIDRPAERRDQLPARPGRAQRSDGRAHARPQPGRDLLIGEQTRSASDAIPAELADRVVDLGGAADRRGVLLERPGRRRARGRLAGRRSATSTARARSCSNTWTRCPGPPDGARHTGSSRSSSAPSRRASSTACGACRAGDRTQLAVRPLPAAAAVHPAHAHRCGPRPTGTSPENDDAERNRRPRGRHVALGIGLLFSLALLPDHQPVPRRDDHPGLAGPDPHRGPPKGRDGRRRHRC